MGQGQFKVRLTGGTGAAFAEKGRAYDLNQPCPTILGTKPNQFEVDMTRFAIGKEWDKLRPGEASEKYFNLVRPHPDQPCPTICASHGHPGVASVTHPTEKRKLTIHPRFSCTVHGEHAGPPGANGGGAVPGFPGQTTKGVQRPGVRGNVRS